MLGGEQAVDTSSTARQCNSDTRSSRNMPAPFAATNDYERTHPLNGV
jgi:hypothetical protein